MKSKAGFIQQAEGGLREATSVCLSLGYLRYERIMKYVKISGKLTQVDGLIQKVIFRSLQSFIPKCYINAGFCFVCF